MAVSFFHRYPSLRVAYIDEVEDTTVKGKSVKTYYSVLVKGGDKLDEVSKFRSHVFFCNVEITY